LTTREQQESVREWLQIKASGQNADDARRAIDALEWIAELGRAGAGGPMVQIRCRGPVSISELKAYEG
jgi:hypothetical protein